ncbi:MAG: GDP-mannose 4,6-dehydratase, partial [Elusimicrobiota bacterium]|nr:GDP-mannose 4,6-dehydratase [Elusimicrobiota bacterium]
PVSPYGIGKLAVEYYMKFYTETYGLKTISLRYTNVYGPRQDPFGEAGVVAIFSQRMLSKGGRDSVFIYGNGNQLRDYVYIDDVVQANLIALNYNNSTILNIGTGKTTSVNELFNIMKQITGYSKEPIYQPARHGELFKSFVDISKAKQEFNWEPKTNLELGLKKTIEYFASKIRVHNRGCVIASHEVA